MTYQRHYVPLASMTLASIKRERTNQTGFVSPRLGLARQGDLGRLARCAPPPD